MSKDAFMIHYSSCKDFNREIKSNINYITEIIERASKSNNEMNEMSSNGKKIWSPSDCVEENNSLKTSLSTERERYEDFHVKFENFYINTENVDSQLASYVSAQISSVEENEDNYSFLIAMIQLNNNDVITEGVYQMLLDSGLTEEGARNLVVLLSIEGQNEILRLSNLTNEELEKERKRLLNKKDKTVLDKIIEELLAYPNPKNFINDLATELADGSFTSYVEKAILGRSLAQAELDVDAIKKSINKLMEKIVQPNLSKAAKSKVKDMLTNLNLIGGARISKINFAESATKALKNLGKAVSYAIIAVEALESGMENWENYKNYGEDGARATYDFGIDLAAIGGSIFIGIKAGAFAGSLFGPIGTGAGAVAGVIGGILAGVATSSVINELGDMIYDDILEPAADWWNDTCNDVGDWWDSLWW